MTILRRFLLTLASLLLLAPSADLRAQGRRPAAPPAPAWSEVELGVRKMLFFSGRLRMTRRQAAYPGEGPYHGKLLTLIETTSDAQAFGNNVARAHTTSWFDPATGTSVAFEEYRERKRLKRLLFHDDGYREIVMRPEDGKEKAPPESWTTTRDVMCAYRLNDGSAVPEGVPVRDYYNMVADLGRLDIAEVGTADYYVATKGRVVRFQVTFGETTSRRFGLTDLAHGKDARLALRLRRIDLEPVGEDPEDIGGLFAMEGGTEIWLERETGLVAIIAGNVPSMPGRTEILLRGARFEGVGLGEALLAEPAADEGPEPVEAGSR